MYTTHLSRPNILINGYLLRHLKIVSNSYSTFSSIIYAMYDISVSCRHPVSFKTSHSTFLFTLGNVSSKSTKATCIVFIEFSVFFNYLYENKRTRSALHETVLFFHNQALAL